MTFKEFKNIIKNRYEGYDIQFQKNEAQYVACIDNFIFQSNPYSEQILVFMSGQYVGLMIK
jgi:hypothetical protein